MALLTHMSDIGTKTQVCRLKCSTLSTQQWLLCMITNTMCRRPRNSWTNKVETDAQKLQDDKHYQLTDCWTRRIRGKRLGNGVAAVDVTALPCNSDRRFCAISAFCCFRSSSSRFAATSPAAWLSVGADDVAASCCGFSDTFSWAAATAFCFSALSSRQHNRVIIIHTTHTTGFV